MREVAARLAQLDQGLEARAALGHVFFGQDGFVQAEFLHQGAFLRLADLHAQGLDLLDRGRGFGGFLHFAFQVGFDVRQVGVVGVRGFGAGLGFAAALGRGLGRGGACGLGRAAGAFLGRFGGFGFGGGLGAGGLGFFGGGCLGGRLGHGHSGGFLGHRGGCGALFGRRCSFGGWFLGSCGSGLGGGAGGGLGRLRRLLSRHGQPRVQKGNKENASATGPGAGGTAKAGPSRFEGSTLRARCLGEHLVCSPCGEVGSCACVSRWPGPEVLLSLLPTNLTLYRLRVFSSGSARNDLQCVAFLFQRTVALQGGRVVGRLRDQGLLLGLDVLDQHAVEQVAQLQL